MPMWSRSHTLRTTAYAVSWMAPIMYFVNQVMYFLHLGLNCWGKPFSDLGLYETLLCLLFTIIHGMHSQRE